MFGTNKINNEEKQIHVFKQNKKSIKKNLKKKKKKMCSLLN